MARTAEHETNMGRPREIRGTPRMFTVSVADDAVAWLERRYDVPRSRSRGAAVRMVIDEARGVVEREPRKRGAPVRFALGLGLNADGTRLAAVLLANTARVVEAADLAQLTEPAKPVVMADREWPIRADAPMAAVVAGVGALVRDVETDKETEERIPLDAVAVAPIVGARLLVAAARFGAVVAACHGLGLDVAEWPADLQDRWRKRDAVEWAKARIDSWGTRSRTASSAACAALHAIETAEGREAS